MPAEYLSELWSQKQIYRNQLEKLDYSHLPKDVTKPRQIVWHLMNNVTEIPTCQNKTCQNDVEWWHKDYRRFCSRKCARNSAEVQVKIQQTSIERYGVENPAQSKEIKERIKETNLEKYGVENPFQSDEIKEKISATNITKYGVQFPAQIIGSHDKRKATSLERYGVEHHAQLQISESTRNILFDKDKLTEFMKTKTVHQSARELEISESTILAYIEKYSVTDYIQPTKSYLEDEMKQILIKLNINFIENTRTIIAPYELDFYLPDHQMAIEMNGDYWHSDRFLLENHGMTADEYHQMKTDRCQELGIELIHISESDWNEWKSK